MKNRNRLSVLSKYSNKFIQIKVFRIFFFIIIICRKNIYFFNSRKISEIFAKMIVSFNFVKKFWYVISYKLKCIFSWLKYVLQQFKFTLIVEFITWIEAHKIWRKKTYSKSIRTRIPNRFFRIHSFVYVFKICTSWINYWIGGNTDSRRIDRTFKTLKANFMDTSQHFGSNIPILHFTFYTYYSIKLTCQVNYFNFNFMIDRGGRGRWIIFFFSEGWEL